MEGLSANADLLSLTLGQSNLFISVWGPLPVLGVMETNWNLRAWTWDTIWASLQRHLCFPICFFSSCKRVLRVEYWPPTALIHPYCCFHIVSDKSLFLTNVQIWQEKFTSRTSTVWGHSASCTSGNCPTLSSLMSSTRNSRWDPWLFLFLSSRVDVLQIPPWQLFGIHSNVLASGASIHINTSQCSSLLISCWLSFPVLVSFHHFMFISLSLSSVSSPSSCSFFTALLPCSLFFSPLCTSSQHY